jgi:hypothetical protein
LGARKIELCFGEFGASTFNLGIERGELGDKG